MQAWVVGRVRAFAVGCANFVALRSFKIQLASFFIAAFAMIALLSGCAEVNHRGGIIARVADDVVFPATAKSHRVLRAYVVFASLVTIANNRGVPSGDKLVVNARVFQTMNVIEEAFICAYATRSGCVFFDEKMARVDYNLYKLALLVLVRSETRAMITELQRELLPKIPVVGSGLAAASSAADAAAHTATAGVETAQIVESLIKLGYDAAVDLGPLFPIYRDAQELDMVVVVDMLARRCIAEPSLKNRVQRNVKPVRQTLDEYADNKPIPATQPCIDFARGMKLYKDGNGSLEHWRQFTTEMGAVYLADMTPSSDHFLEVSSMLLSACVRIVDPDGVMLTSSNSVVPQNCMQSVLFGLSPKGPLEAAERSAFNLAYHPPSTVLPVATPTGKTIPDAKATLSKMEVQ